MPKEVSVSGVVWGAFKHRFAIKTDSGKTLIDIGPKGAEKFDLSEGDRVEAKGEKKPSEVKVHSLKVGGKTHKIDWPPKHGPKHDDASPDIAKRAVMDEGYDVAGEPERRPKHWEVQARRNGRAYEIHVELDGAIRHIKPAR